MPVIPESSSLVADMTGPSGLSDQDAAFLRQAQLSGLEEIEAGKLALRNAGDSAVQEFGRWMETDHAAIRTTLAALSARVGVSLPTKPDPQHQAALNDLSGKTGPDFDQSYVAEQVNDHQDAVALFQKEASEGDNASVKSVAQQALPLLQAHLEQAQILAGGPPDGLAADVAPAGDDTSIPSSTSGPMEEVSSTTDGSNSISSQDIAFVQQAATGGLTEVAEGKLAASHTQNQAVSEFGRWMVADHGSINNVLAQIAQQEGIELLTTMTPDQQAEVNSLQSLSDPEFFKKYVAGQVGDHMRTTMQFIKEAVGGQNPAVVAFARNELPILQQHLAESLKLDFDLHLGTAPDGILKAMRESMPDDQPTFPGITVPDASNLHTMICGQS